jgi:hypothetical protein
MWLLVGILVALFVTAIGVVSAPFELAVPVALATVGGMILGALFWIIDLLVQIRNKLPTPAPRDPHLLAKERRGLPRRVAPARKYRLQRPQ